MKRIIIFGITGAVGAYTALYLRQKGYDIIGVGKRNSDNHFFKKYNIPYHSVDISKKEEFNKLPKVEIDIVLHFAGSMPSKMKGYKPQQYIDSIITGTYNVLEYTRTVKASKIIFTQTRADSAYLMGTKEPIAADIEKKFPLKGDHTVYTICKNAATNLIEHYNHEYGINYNILRLPTIYAYHPNKYFYVNGEKKPKAYRLLIDKAINGDEIEIWGDPSKEKEIVYVLDLVQIVEKGIEKSEVCGTFNVGRGVGVSLEEQITGIVDIFSKPEKKSKIVYRPEKPDGRQFVHDITKTKEELGFEPMFDYITLLKEFKREIEMNRFALLWGAEQDNK
ncbi:NAD(P)-dependent oxidoreductase [Marinilabiliaceae bacterium ANBcel2]|nr:NAD(P)-dependent oxidoreductase [Marinilabiliaceae bacterium ANBcel2]